MCVHNYILSITFEASSKSMTERADYKDCSGFLKSSSSQLHRATRLHTLTVWCLNLLLKNQCKKVYYFVMITFGKKIKVIGLNVKTSTKLPV